MLRIPPIRIQQTKDILFSIMLFHLISTFLLMFTLIIEANGAQIFVADIFPIPGVTSNISGRVIVFGESNVIGFAGYVDNVQKTITERQCILSNRDACGASIHSGTSCDSTLKQGEHLYGVPISTDPWIKKFYLSDSTGFGRFGDILDIGTKSVAGKTFIVKSLNGTRVACGILKEVTDVENILTAELDPFDNSNQSGSVVAYRLTNGINSSVVATDPRTDNICFFVEGRGLTPNIQSYLVNKTSKDCNVTNGCGIHVHDTQSCSSGVLSNYYWDANTFPINPWSLPGGNYLTTNEFGQALQTSCVATGKASFEDQAFILHANNGDRVACGLLQYRGIPTPSPTKEGTLAPTLVDNGRNFTICFSGSSTVEAENVGIIPINQLNIGDYIRSGNGLYTQVYGFGHFDQNLEAEFLQINFEDQSLDDNIRFEISPKHLVFVDRTKKHHQITIRASDIVVGDIISNKKVSSIHLVTRRGVYAPFTQTGDLLVGNIRVSNYVDILEYNWFLDQHTLGHAYMFPRRLFCHYFVDHCKEETYTNGYSCWARFILRFASIINAFKWRSSMIVSSLAAPFVTMIYMIKYMTIIGFCCLVILVTRVACMKRISSVLM